MPVQSAEEVLNRFVREFLEERVDEDTMVTYSVCMVTRSFSCEDHPEDTWLDDMWRISMCLTSVNEEDPRSPVRIYAVVPLDILDDGDCDPLRQVLEQQWSETTFSALLGDLGDTLDKVVEEVGEIDQPD